jgi:hypothetical protein
MNILNYKLDTTNELLTKNVKKMTLDELRAELNDSDIHTRKIEICTQIYHLLG